MGNQQATLNEISWLAGIWDGEGTIGVRHSVKIHQFSPRMHIVNSNSLIIQRSIEIMEKLGITPYIREKGTGAFEGSKKQCWAVGVDNLTKSKILLDCLMPYFVGKKAQAQILLKFVDSRLERFDRKKPNAEKGYTQEDMDNIKKLYELNGNQRRVPRDYTPNSLKRDDIVQSQVKA